MPPYFPPILSTSSFFVGVPYDFSETSQASAMSLKASSKAGGGTSIALRTQRTLADE